MRIQQWANSRRHNLSRTSGGRGPQTACLAAVALDIEPLGLREGMDEPNDSDRKSGQTRNRDQKLVVARDPAAHEFRIGGAA
jgi:hypothetical protein